MVQPCRWGSFVLVAVGLSACGGHTVGDEQPDDSDIPSLTTPVYPSADGDGTTEGGIELLNAYRAQAGLGAVVQDPALSAACLGHLRYLDWESTHNAAGACVLSHAEDDPGNPHHASDTAAAGAGSLLACQRTPSPQLPMARAVERWVNSLYHRVPLLDPRLTRIGAASYAGYSCLYYADGIDSSLAGSLVLWPASRMVDVPVEFAGRETPCPTHPEDPTGIAAEQCPSAGFIVTATWYGAGHPLAFPQGQPSARLSYADDASEVPLLALYAGGVEGFDPLPGGIPDTVALVPARPLEQNRPLVVEVNAPSASQSVLRWSFTTGSRDE